VIGRGENGINVYCGKRYTQISKKCVPVHSQEVILGRYQYPAQFPGRSWTGL